MQAQAIITKARRLLADEGAERFTDADLLDWLNSGQRQIVALRPDASATKATIVLVAGAEQSIPVDGTRLLNIPNNVAPTRRGITFIETDALNAINLNWREADNSGYIEHYTFDQDDPKAFEVYPPAIAGQTIRVLYAKTPVDVPNLGSAIALEDIYEGPLVDWVVYRASSQPKDSPDDAQRAATAAQSFVQALIGKGQSDQNAAPQRK